MHFLELKWWPNDFHFQYQPRVFKDACLVQIWWSQLKSVMRYHADKVKFTEGRTDGQMDRRRQWQLEQLERLRSEDTPCRLMITHTIESCWIPSQNKAEWPWRYRSRSKVITCDTPSHASDHLYQIWKESIQNYRHYRADTIFKVKAEWPWKYWSR